MVLLVELIPLVPLVLLAPLVPLVPLVLLVLLVPLVLAHHFFTAAALSGGLFVKLSSRRAFCTLNHFSHSMGMFLHVRERCQIQACILKASDEIFTDISVNIFSLQS